MDNIPSCTKRRVAVATSRMYCEVFVKHRAVISEDGLQKALDGRLGADIQLDDAYAMSAVYRDHRPAHSIEAFETVGNCFVIVRKVNSRLSTYHVEGNTAAVSVQALLRAVQDFAGFLLPVLRTVPATPSERARDLSPCNSSKIAVKKRVWRGS
jgi:hypothetical protein